jgi:tripartite-type tricarboxylate transporter receptor subunit TctC
MTGDNHRCGARIGDAEHRCQTLTAALLLMSMRTVTDGRFRTSHALLHVSFPVAVNYSDLMLVVNPAVAVNSLPELIALAKAQPGKLNYASSGPGTPYHMAGELFKSMAGLDIVHVPYKESSAARTGVLGGQVEMMFDAVTTMNEQAKAGKVAPARDQRQDALGGDAERADDESACG